MPIYQDKTHTHETTLKIHASIKAPINAYPKTVNPCIEYNNVPIVSPIRFNLLSLARKMRSLNLPYDDE